MAYIGQGIKNGTFSVLDTSGNTYNGSNVTFSLGTQVGSPAQLLVSHDGVIQKPGTDYTLATGGTQITFTTAPASGASIFIVEISGAVGGPINGDLDGAELILDTDGDTSITADTDDQIDIKVGGSDRFKFDNSGHLSLLTDSGAIKFGADSDVTLTHDPDDGLFLKSIATGDDNPVLLTLQTGETDIAADDVIGAINFQAPDEGTGTDAILVAAGIEAVSEGDFSSSSNATKLSFKTGASEAAAEKMSLSSVGLLTLTSNDPNIKMIDTNTNSYSQLTNTNGTITIEADKGAGSGSSEIRFSVDNSQKTMIDSDGKMATGGETAPDVDAGGLCLDQNATDDVIFSAKSSDVAHGVTTRAETDTYYQIQKTNGPDGGAQMYHFRENAENAMYCHAVGVGSLGTGKSTSEAGLISLRAHLKGSGTDTDGTITSNGNLMTIHAHNTTRFIFDAEGDLHSDSSNTTFDAYDDAQLVRDFDLSHGRGVVDSKFDKFVAYNHEKLAELQLVGREKDGTPNHFINVTGMQRLHNGAIWQQYEKHNQLLEAVYDLAKEAVGEEKANAILDKHEVKRLQ